MMQPASMKLNVNIRVLVEYLNSSAEQVFKDTVVGEVSLDNLRRIVYGLDGIDLQRTDVLTFEHEFVPNELVKEIESEGFNVQPNSSALQYAQNKILMRQKMDQIQEKCRLVKNPKYAVVRNPKEATAFANANDLKHLVVKTPTGGYDGKGVVFIDSKSVNEIQTHFTQFPELLVEEKLDFDMEISCLIARSQTETKVYPITQTIQENGVCRTTITPAPKLNDQERQIAREIGSSIADSLDVKGILAVEMFYKNGEFYINELAMRPHNTGHWTIDGAVTSQFENHIRAVLDLPLGSTEKISDNFTVMQNILGSNLSDLTDVLPDVLMKHTDLKIELYGKEIRKGRKLGHINISGDDYLKLIEIAKTASDLFEGVNNDRI